METEQTPDPDSNIGTAALLDAMRKALDDAEIGHQSGEGGDYIIAPFKLKNIDVEAVFYGEPGDVVVVVVTMPLRIPEDARHLVGEFFLRANYEAKRGIWEMDYDDGEVRARVCADTIDSNFSGDQLLAMLGSLLRAAEVFFPFIVAVMSRAMKPAVAIDQAKAAYLAAIEDSKTGDGDDGLEDGDG